MGVERYTFFTEFQIFQAVESGNFFRWIFSGKNFFADIFSMLSLIFLILSVSNIFLNNPKLSAGNIFKILLQVYGNNHLKWLWAYKLR